MIKNQFITVVLAFLFFPSAAQDTTYINITKPGSGTQADHKVQVDSLGADSKTAYLIIKAFKNNKIKTLKSPNIKFLIDEKQVEFINAHPHFIIPQIDKAEVFRFYLRYKKENYWFSWPYDKIKYGAEILIGKITTFNRLNSATKYVGIDRNNASHQTNNIKFNIEEYLVDLQNYKDVKDLNFLFLDPSPLSKTEFICKVRIAKSKTPLILSI
jgi:hypothetical protein